ncbi:MAG: hypothetical protein AAF211_07730 [Myxococcota bacterium]
MAASDPKYRPISARPRLPLRMRHVDTPPAQPRRHALPTADPEATSGAESDDAVESVGSPAR